MMHLCCLSLEFLDVSGFCLVLHSGRPCIFSPGVPWNSQDNKLTYHLVWAGLKLVFKHQLRFTSRFHSQNLNTALYMKWTNMGETFWLLNCSLLPAKGSECTWRASPLPSSFCLERIDGMDTGWHSWFWQAWAQFPHLVTSFVVPEQ